MTRRREGVVVVVEKNVKSRRTFNKNYCNLLTAITHTKILAVYFIICDKKTEVWVAHYGSKACLLFRSNHISTGMFWATVCKTVCPICYQTGCCLSVTLYYCGQTVGWIKIKLGKEVGLGPGHTVLDGDSAPPPKRGTTPNFGAYLLWWNGWMD